MRHATGQENPERLRYWYCPDCGKRHEVTHEVQALQSALSESVPRSELEPILEKLEKAFDVGWEDPANDEWVLMARDALASLLNPEGE